MMYFKLKVLVSANKMVKFSASDEISDILMQQLKGCAHKTFWC